MSDYISKSAVIEALEKVKSEIQTPADTVWNNAVKVCIDNVIEAPTLSETEIIRKSFERVIQQLSEQMPIKFNGFGKTLITVEDVIKILKEECGISE